MRGAGYLVTWLGIISLYLFISGIASPMGSCDYDELSRTTTCMICPDCSNHTYFGVEFALRFIPAGLIAILFRNSLRYSIVLCTVLIFVGFVPDILVLLRTGEFTIQSILSTYGLKAEQVLGTYSIAIIILISRIIPEFRIGVYPGIVVLTFTFIFMLLFLPETNDVSKNIIIIKLFGMMFLVLVASELAVYICKSMLKMRQHSG